MSAVDRAAPTNPLVEGLERLPVHPTTLVIFGATGDLAKRKLLPAIYNLAHEGALPERFNLIGVSRCEMPTRSSARWRAGGIKEFSRRQPDAAVLDELLDERPLRARARSTTTSVYERCSETLDEFDKARRRAAEPLLLPLDRADVLPGDRRASSASTGCASTRAPTCAS